jgi:tRNA pseudouridine55 synthase
VFGFINLNKPQGISSRDAVNVVQRLVKPAKVGHCGTLDPLASGVLVVCVGPATRLTKFVQDSPKTYAGSFRLGLESNTEDTEGQVVALDSPPIISAKQLEETLDQFVGKIEQVPPAFSAIKVDGKRAYDVARRGGDVTLKARTIEIFSLRLSNFSYPDFELEIQCGSGTYVRSLGRDIARKLDSAAVMTGLVRTAIGEFSIEQAVEPSCLSRSNLAENIGPVEVGLSKLPTVVLNDDQAAALINAVPIDLDIESDGTDVVAKNQQDRVLAILKHRGGRSYSPKINFAGYWNK